MQRNEADRAPNDGGLHRILRRGDLPGATGLSVAHLYELMAKGEFPKPIKLGERASGWLASEIAAWQTERIARRDEGAA